MKVQGQSQNVRRGFDVIGKITKVGEMVGDDRALEIEVLRGSMKGKKILMTLDAEITGKNENSNKIGPKGLVSSNKKISGVDGIVHIQGADYTSQKDDEVTTMKGRWAYMAGSATGDEVVTVEPASLLVIPNNQRNDVRLIWPEKGTVVRDRAALADTILNVAKENKSEQQIYLFSMSGTDLNVGIVSRMKNDNGTYVERTEDEMKALIEQRIGAVPADANEVAVVPGSLANLSKQAGTRMVDNKAVKVDLIPGITAKDIMLSNGTWSNEVDGSTGSIVNRVEHATLRAAGALVLGTRTAAELELSDENKFKRILGQIEGYPANDAAAEDDAQASDENVDTSVDDEDPFADLPEAEEASAGPR